jgi:hypothetical protein
LPAERFTAATAKTLGRSERAVQLDAERGEKIAPDVLDRVAGTHLDKNRYLDELKGLPHKEQRERVGADLNNDNAGADVGKKQARDLKAKHQAAEALAERIVSNFSADELDAATANAFACGALHLGRALARLSALEPVMDRKIRVTVLDLPRPPSVNELYRNVPGKGRVKTADV